MKYIPECFRSVYSQSYEDFEVIMVDNASTDESASYVEQNYPDAIVIRSKSNLVYGPGNNLGARRARGKILLFLNHDTVVTSDFLTDLVTAMHNDADIGIAQSRILRASSPELVDSVGAYLARSGMWIHPFQGEPDQSEGSTPYDVLGTSGACLMVTAELFDELGGFDPDFLIYFDDYDLSWRARLLGYRAVVVPESTIYHWGGATTQALPSAFTVFHSFKNRLCSLIKLLPPLDLLRTLPIHLLLCFGGGIGYTIRLNPSNSLAISKAILWNVLNLPETLEKRRQISQVSLDDMGKDQSPLSRPMQMAYFLRTSLEYFSKWST